MRRSMKRIVAGVVGVGLCVSLAAVTQAGAQLRRQKGVAEGRAMPSRAETEVAVIGDSITNLAAPTFTRELEGRGFPAPFVSGINGIRSDERVAEAPALIRAHTRRVDVLVIELGTNDVGQFVHDHPGASAAARDAHARSVAANVDAITAAAGPTCVVVVNVSANTLSPEANDVADAENRALWDWVRTDRRAHLADWDGLVASEFAHAEPEGAMTTDMVHPTPHGADRLADLVADTIDVGCRPG